MTALQIQNDEFIISVAKPGENVKIVVKVSPTEEEFLGKGSVVSHPLSPCTVTSEIVAQLVILQLLESKVCFLFVSLNFTCRFFFSFL
jgi:translation elongation factor EF-1alpha